MVSSNPQENADEIAEMIQQIGYSADEGMTASMLMALEGGANRLAGGHVRKEEAALIADGLKTTSGKTLSEEAAMIKTSRKRKLRAAKCVGGARLRGRSKQTGKQKAIAARRLRIFQFFLIYTFLTGVVGPFELTPSAGYEAASEAPADKPREPDVIFNASAQECAEVDLGLTMGRPCSSMGRPWLTMVDRGPPWSTMTDLGRPCSSMVVHA